MLFLTEKKVRVQHSIIRINIRIFSRSLLLALGIFLITFSAKAASLSFTTNGSDNYAVGQIFSVSVNVSTDAGQPMNAVSGVISYPTDLLQLISADKTGSIIDFWISDSFSNAEGKASYEGGVYNPGYSGARGKIISYLFKAKAPGTATFSFSSASVLANDGKGTNILDRTGTASVTISAVAPTQDLPQGDIQAIAIYSKTHPDRNKWYSDPNVELWWNLTPNVSALRMGVDQDRYSLPAPDVLEPVSEKFLTLKDGIWYFHLQARYKDGGWGPVSHYGVQIDTSVVPVPVLNNVPANLVEGDDLAINGTALPASTVVVSLKDSTDNVRTQETTSDSDGHFSMIWDRKLTHDTYSLTAKTVNPRGISSQDSAVLRVVVRQPAYQRVAWPILNYITLFLIVLTAIILCMAWAWYLFHRFSRFRRRVRAEVKRADQKIEARFKRLEDIIISHVDQLRSEQAKRRLTPQEERMVLELSKALQKTEDYIEEEIRDIGK